MSVQSSEARPAGTSIGAAVVGLVATLVVLVVVFALFLIAPLALMGLALPAYLVVRRRSERARPSATHESTAGAVDRFGAGPR